MQFVKSNHRATLKNEDLGELIHTFNNVLSRFPGTTKSNKVNTDNYCTLFNVKLALFTVFVLTLQTGFATLWCFWFSANNSSNKHVSPPLVYTMCKEALLPIKRNFCNQRSLWRCKCAVPPDHLRSEISSRTLATFQNIGKARKQEAIWIKCV